MKQSDWQLDLKIIQDDNKFVVTHDGNSVAWFRWKTDAELFVKAITGEPSVPEQMWNEVMTSTSVPFKMNHDDLDHEHPFEGWTEPR